MSNKHVAHFNMDSKQAHAKRITSEEIIIEISGLLRGDNKRSIIYLGLVLSVPEPLNLFLRDCNYSSKSTRNFN